MGKTLTRAIQNPAMTRWEEKAEGGLPGVTVGRELPDHITVSVICPTLHRQHLHEQIYQVFTSQTHEHKDLWVMEDSGAPSPFFTQLGDSDPRVHYVDLSPWRVTTGCKRNWMVERSTGSIIAHFDDDDWYAPNYLSSMVERLVREDADFVKLGTWNEKRTSDGHRWQERPRDHGARWGYGFSYVYRRYVCTRVHTPDKTKNEDIAFLEGVRRARMKAVLIEDGADWVEHRLHGHNTSKRA
jgi:hypothetical protein